MLKNRLNLNLGFIAIIYKVYINLYAKPANLTICQSSDLTDRKFGTI